MMTWSLRGETLRRGGRVPDVGCEGGSRGRRRGRRRGGRCAAKEERGGHDDGGGFWCVPSASPGARQVGTRLVSPRPNLGVSKITSRRLVHECSYGDISQNGVRFYITSLFAFVVKTWKCVRIGRAHGARLSVRDFSPLAAAQRLRRCGSRERPGDRSGVFD